MKDIVVVWHKKNRQFEIRRLYDGFVLHRSGVFKNANNAWGKLLEVCVEKGFQINIEVITK